MNLFDLSGKVALITGGAGYLGTAMSTALAGYGAQVIIASRDGEKCERLARSLKEKYQSNCYGISMDISCEQSVFQGIEKVLEKNRRIDVLVNNAAFSVTGYFEELTNDDWQRAIDGTVNSVFRVCSAVLPCMVKQQSGSIINVASMYGMVSPDPAAYHGERKLNNPACYGAGKAAIIQLTKYIAAYYGRQGIRCNTLTPGPFPTPKVQKTKWFIEELEKRTMIGRIGEPQQLQGALLLLSSDAGSYITGANICVDGGWTAW